MCRPYNIYLNNLNKRTYTISSSYWYCFQCLSEYWYFEVGETYICGHLCVTWLLFCICSPNPRVLSQMWSQLLYGTFSFLIARCIRGPGFVLIRLACRCVIDVVLLGWVCCTRLIRTKIAVCSTGWVQGCCQPMVASVCCVFFSFSWRRCLWGCERDL